MTEWRCVEDDSIQVDLWIATPNEGTSEHASMMSKLGEHVDSIGLCVTATRTFFRYTGGTELGLRIGFRNDPRFPNTLATLLATAEQIGYAIAEAGGQKTFMIEESGGSVYWFTRNEEHHSEDHEWVWNHV